MKTDRGDVESSEMRRSGEISTTGRMKDRPRTGMNGGPKMCQQVEWIEKNSAN